MNLGNSVVAIQIPLAHTDGKYQIPESTVFIKSVRICSKDQPVVTPNIPLNPSNGVININFSVNFSPFFQTDESANFVAWLKNGYNGGI